MADQLALQPRYEEGWLMGFANLLRKENDRWWRKRSWFMRLILWMALTNGVMMAVLTSPPKEGDTNPYDNAITVFTIFVGLVPAIGVAVAMQDSLIGEKQSGTLAWVLSKPVSRPAVIFSKLAASTLRSSLQMVIPECILAYFILSGAGIAVPIAGWLLALLMLFLNLLFYLTLTLMLGALFETRGPVMSIPLACIFAAQIVPALLPPLGQITPWPMIMPLPGGLFSLAGLALRGDPLPTMLPILATMIWIVVFIVVAVWRFQREEF